MKLMKGKPIKNLGKPSDIHQALFVCVQTYLVTKKEGFTIHVLYLTYEVHTNYILHTHLRCVPKSHWHQNWY